jgi:hypothetical protein
MSKLSFRLNQFGLEAAIFWYSALLATRRVLRVPAGAREQRRRQRLRDMWRY